MADHLENLILTEARRQGIQPNADAMRKATVDLAGASLTAQGLIHMPNLGTISPADFVRSLHSQTPESFADLDDKPAEPVGSLTASMMREVAANRRKQSLPDDWKQVRGKYDAGSLTARYMEELAASHRGK